MFMGLASINHQCIKITDSLSDHGLNRNLIETNRMGPFECLKVIINTSIFSTSVLVLEDEGQLDMTHYLSFSAKCTLLIDNNSEDLVFNQIAPNLN